MDLDQEAMEKITKEAIAIHVRMLSKRQNTQAQEHIEAYNKLSPEERRTVLVYCMGYLESSLLGTAIQKAFVGGINIATIHIAEATS